MRRTATDVLKGAIAASLWAGLMGAPSTGAHAASPPELVRCVYLYDLWRHYAFDPVQIQNGQRARAELAIDRCRHGDYPESIAVLEEMLRRGGFTTPETLGKVPSR